METNLYTDHPSKKDRLSWTNDSFLDTGQLEPNEVGVYQSAICLHESSNAYLAPVRSDPKHQYIMTDVCIKKVMKDLNSRPPEHAGALFGPTCSQPLITCYRSFRPNGTPVMFTVDGAEVMGLIKSLKPRDLELKGFVHSHPDGVYELSHGDCVYVRKQLANPKNTDDVVFMPIVCEGSFLPFVVDKYGSVTRPDFHTFCCKG